VCDQVQQLYQHTGSGWVTATSACRDSDISLPTFNQIQADSLTWTDAAPRIGSPAP